jgi:hypothetical protein
MTLPEHGMDCRWAKLMRQGKAHLEAAKRAEQFRVARAAAITSAEATP